MHSWVWEHQCPYRGGETEDNKQLGKIDLNCPETLHDTANSQGNGNLSPRPHNIDPQYASKLYPQLQYSPRAFEQLQFRFPTPGNRGWTESLHF